MQSRRLRFVAAPVVFAIAALCASCGSSATSSATASGATHKGRGVVVAVNVEKGRIKINHEKIEGFMDAMTMWFDVKDPAMLSGIAPSDKVEFTLVEEPSADVLTELRKSPS